MSYMRWPLYAWTSSECPDDEPDPLDCKDPTHERMHLWPAAGDPRVGVLDMPEAYDREGGVNIRMDLFDELVVCRYAQLLADGLLADTLARVLDPNSATNGNFGSWDLLTMAGEDPLSKFREAMEEARAAREGSAGKP